MLTCIAATAAAEPTAAELTARGEQLARDGHYVEAIDAFKSADRLQPTANHMCLIALAYTRRELWPQAEIFLAQCRRRATAADPLPDWFDDAERQMTERLAAANVAAIAIVTDPQTPSAELAVSSFAPDEKFEPRTIHLPPGRHVIIVNAPGYDEAQRSIDVVDRTPQHVVIRLYPTGTTPGRFPPPPSRVPHVMVVAGIAAVGFGLLTWGWMGYERSQLVDARTHDDIASYDAHAHRFDVAKYATIGLWATGAGLAITGYLLGRGHHEAPAISLAPTTGGGVLALGWQQ